MLGMLERLAKKKSRRLDPKIPSIAPKIPAYQRTIYLDELKTVLKEKPKEN
jgi:hypothetical protein